MSLSVFVFTSVLLACSSAFALSCACHEYKSASHAIKKNASFYVIEITTSGAKVVRSWKGSQKRKTLLELAETRRNKKDWQKSKYWIIVGDTPVKRLNPVSKCNRLVIGVDEMPSKKIAIRHLESKLEFKKCSQNPSGKRIDIF